ncbi:hypothetical protein [Paenibacillus nasutitermitis]|uniref:Uncharacterized protein n=1 Tax=Paenibacillus nasutitermitis TaxID=1652958 RepID=A0A916ZFQ4_9BACL|nr:hypothetical protein [Paenibacillus nasutitermitis]GGD95251.1 hypothetical protein GCM10010911_62450 [Paenibacillus nasutitermitis]
MMSRFMDWTLLALYTFSALSALFMLVSQITYLKERIKSGVVSAFLLAMLFFLFSYALSMGIMLWISLTELLGIINEVLEELQKAAWLTAQLAAALGLLLLSIQTYKKRYDAFIHFKKIRKRKDD